MIVILAIVVAWIGAGVLNAGMIGGWRYYDLYPQYPMLGTPDEQWDEAGPDHQMWFIAFLGGVFGLLICPFMFGTRLKY